MSVYTLLSLLCRLLEHKQNLSVQKRPVANQQKVHSVMAASPNKCNKIYLPPVCVEFWWQITLLSV